MGIGNTAFFRGYSGKNPDRRFTANGDVAVAMEKAWKPHWTVRADSPAGGLTAEIGQVRRHDAMPGVWLCPVRIASIFQNEKQIASVDEEQALERSLLFVRTVFGDNGADADNIEARRVGNDETPGS